MKLKTVLIGCGAISKKHLEAMRQNSDRYHLVGVFDIDPERAEAVAFETGAQAFSDMEVMADVLNPDVAAIATPSALHADQAVFWLNHGAHIVLEKPIALSSRDIVRIKATAETAGRWAVVGYVLRYAPHVRLLARAVQENRFGRIFHVGLSVYWNRNDDYFTSATWRGTWEHDGGTLMNQATHGIDLLQWLLGGKPTSVRGTLGRFMRPIQADDFAAATVEFEGGGIGTVTATVDTYPRNLGTRLTILGERGTVELSGNGPDAISVWRFPEDPAWSAIDEALASDKPVSDARQAEALAGHAGVYQDLANAVETDTSPIADLESSAVSAEIVLGIQKSHLRGETIEFPVDFDTRLMIEANL